MKGISGSIVFFFAILFPLFGHGEQISQVLKLRADECRKWKDVVHNFRAQYQIPKMIAGSAISDLSAQKEAVRLVRNWPALPAEFLAEFARLSKIDLSQQNAGDFLQSAASIGANTNCGFMMESQLIEGLAHAATSSTKGIQVREVRELWKLFLNQQLQGSMMTFSFLNIERASRVLANQKLIKITPLFKETMKQVGDFVRNGNQMPSTSTPPTPLETLELANFTQKRLIEEMQLMPKMKIAVQDLLKHN